MISNIKIDLSDIVSQLDPSEILDLIAFEDICDFINNQLDTQELIEMFDIRALQQVEEMDESELYITLQKILKRITNESVTSN